MDWIHLVKGVAQWQVFMNTDDPSDSSKVSDLVYQLNTIVFSRTIHAQ
jgi:hypothetical protein